MSVKNGNIIIYSLIKRIIISPEISLSDKMRFLRVSWIRAKLDDSDDGI